MSHFTRVRTKITDREKLKHALADLKYQIHEDAIVRGYQGAKLMAEVVVRMKGAYDIGFERSSDGTYQVVADWWGVQKDDGLGEQSFVQPVVQRYAYHTVVEQVAKQGFQVVQEATGADQTLKVTVRRWA